MTTYRYGLVLSGANYGPGYATDPEHVIMAETLSDARDILLSAAENYHQTTTLMGTGFHIKGTPGYGSHGDGADIYRVNREDPDFSEVLDEPGDRARHAWGYLLTDYPSHRAKFGPLGGLTITRY